LTGDEDSSNKLWLSAMQEQQDKDVIVSALRQYVLRAVVCIHVTSINNIQGEEDLKDKLF
jgi:hypothetical protein